MPNIEKIEVSRPEGSSFRETTTFDNGTSTDVTLERDGSWTVTDHDADGVSKSYVGVPGVFNTSSGVTRLREK